MLKEIQRIMPMHVSFILPQQVNVAGFENARQGLLEANSFQEMKGQRPIFQVEIIGEEKTVKTGNGNIQINADRLLHQVKNTDLIIIPPVQGDLVGALTANHSLYPWIVEQYQKGAKAASLCLGAFILAQTGLLNGKDCVTHWRANAPFEQLFPKVKLLSDKIITEQDGIFTGGGAFSSANLILYLIEKFTDRETAIHCSKIFQIDTDRTSQTPFIIFNRQKNHGDSEIHTAQSYIEQYFSKKLTVGKLCEISNLGRRSFERRFKTATSNTPLEYIQRIRIEAAKKTLESEQKTVQQIMFEVGYNDTKSFRDLFKKYTGLTPVQYRNKFNIHSHY